MGWWWKKSYYIKQYFEGTGLWRVTFTMGSMNILKKNLYTTYWHNNQAPFKFPSKSDWTHNFSTSSTAFSKPPCWVRKQQNTAIVLARENNIHNWKWARSLWTENGFLKQLSFATLTIIINIYKYLSYIPFLFCTLNARFTTEYGNCLSSHPNWTSPFFNPIWKYYNSHIIYVWVKVLWPSNQEI